MEKYLQYDVQDFAEESSFVNWVRQSDEGDVSFWEAFRQKNPEKSEQIEQAKALVELLVFDDEAVPKAIEDELWKRIESKTQHKQAKVVAMKARPRMLRYLIPAGIAAAIALLVFFNLPSGSNFTPSYDTNVLAASAMRKTVQLPDGSVAYLNASSKLDYDKANWGKGRRLRLRGEAFFEVEKGNSFIVETPTGSVEVLGTSFNVFARGEELKVVCETGKVSVQSGDTETILTKNKNVLVLNGIHSTIDKIPNTARSAWRSGIYAYEGDRIGQVARDIERAYGVQMEIAEDVDYLQFTGSFKTENLESALQEVCWPMDLEYQIDGTKIFVKKK